MTKLERSYFASKLIEKLTWVRKKLNISIILDKKKYRHSLLNFTISFYFLAFLITTPISLLRAIDINWHSINYVHIALLVVITFLQAHKNKLSYHVKVITLILVFYSIGIIADYSLGMALGNYLYFSICILLAATFLSLKNTLLILLAIVLTQLLFMGLTFFEIIAFKVSPLVQINNIHFWGTHITAFITLIASPLIALGWLNKSLKASEHSLKIANENLEYAQKQLIHLAQTDELTSLPNKRALLSYSELEFNKFKRHKNSFSVLMIDIDFFKHVNDTYGHDAGDLVLKSVANVLAKQVRDYEIVARNGGEEFVIILQEQDINISLKIADRIRLAVEKTNTQYQQTNIKVTVSIGLAQVSIDDLSFADSLKRADNNVYKAKESGRNIVII